MVQSREILRREIPIRDTKKRLDVFGTLIAVVDVVRVLPYVASQQRFVNAGQWAACV
jgi:hypothetical protein